MYLHRSSRTVPVIPVFKILIKTEFYRQIFEEYSNTKLKNLQWEPSYSTRTNRDMRKPKVAFSNFANVPKNRNMNELTFVKQ